MVNNIKTGIIGLGYWGPNILRVLLENENVEVAAICDKNEQRLLEISKKFKLYGKVILSTNIESLKYSDIDAFIISTPANTHYEIALKLLSDGKHCFVEKPLAMSTQDALSLNKIAKHNKAKLATGHVFLFNPYILKIKELIKDDKILYINTRRLNFGRIQSDINVVWSLAPHDISICNFLMNSMPIDYDFNISGGCFIQENVEDVAFMTIKYPYNRIANIHVSWIDPVKTRDIIVVTDKKMIYFDDVISELRIYENKLEYLPQENEKAYGIRLRTGDIIIPKVKNTEPLKEEINSFISWILGGKEPINSYLNGCDVVEILDKANRILKKQSNFKKKEISNTKD